MGRISILFVGVLLIASCGADDATEDTYPSPADVLTRPDVPTAPTAATTTTTAATTTTEADGDAWVDGSTVLRAGDCFIEIPVAGEDSPDLEAVPCDTPHLGEVLGTGSACPAAIDQFKFEALASDYLGVSKGQVFDWMESQQITAMSTLRVGADGRVGGTMCYLRAEQGELSRSYRAKSG
jgi:hypothetical protein